MTPTLTAFPPGWPRAARLGIHHKFVRALADQPDARIYRESGTGKDFRADSALVEQGGCAT